MQASLLALLAAIVPAPTVALIDNPTFVSEISLPWNTTNFGQPGTITRLVAGDVTGDLRPDVFARGGTSGNDILFMYAPIQGVAMQKLTPTANDFDIAVGDGLNGVDVLVIVGNDGLRRTHFTGTSMEADVTIVGGNWLNARLLRCGNVNATGGIDYVGVKDVPARDKLIYRRENGTETLITVDHAILDVQLLHWAQNATLQAAVMSAWGIDVYNLETGARSSWFENESGMISDAIAVVHVGTIGPDRLMFASHPSSGNTTSLKQLKRSSAVPEGSTITLAGNDVVAMASCPANIGAGENLIVSFAHARTSLQLTNQAVSSAAPVFSPSNGQQVGIPVTPTEEQSLPLNHAVPIYRDLDNDGLGDVLLVRSASQGTTFEVFTDSFGDGPVYNAAPGGEFFLVQGENPTVYFPQGLYDIPFAFPALEQDWNHLEITVWRQNHLGPDLDWVARGRYLCALPGTDTDPMLASSIPLGNGPVDCLEDVRWLEIRQVHWTGVKIDKVGPTYTAFVALTDDWMLLRPDQDEYPPLDVLGPPPSYEPCVHVGVGPWPVHQQSRRRRTDPPYPHIADPGPLTTTSCPIVAYID